VDTPLIKSFSSSSSPLDVRRLLREAGLRPRKSLGQNFLIVESALERVAAAADLQPQDTVLEIGAGVGSLTRHLAAAARHIGALASAYVEEVDPFPTEGVVGVARSFFGRALLASAEGVYSVDRETDFHLGAELEVVTDFFLRAGYRTEAGDLREGDSGADLAGLTFGLGFRRVRSYRVDYAYASMGDLGGTHRFSFSWIFR